MRLFNCRIEVLLGTFMTKSTPSWLIKVHFSTIERVLREVSGTLFSSDILKANNRIIWFSQTISLNSKHDVHGLWYPKSLYSLLMLLLQSTQSTSQTATDEALVLISSAFFPCMLRIKFSFSLDYEHTAIPSLLQFLADSRKILIQVVFHFTVACHLIMCRFQLRTDLTDAVLHLVDLQIELQYRLLHVFFLQSSHFFISHHVL